MVLVSISDHKEIANEILTHGTNFMINQYMSSQHQYIRLNFDNNFAKEKLLLVKNGRLYL